MTRLNSLLLAIESARQEEDLKTSLRAIVFGYFSEYEDATSFDPVFEDAVALIFQTYFGLSDDTWNEALAEAEGSLPDRKLDLPYEEE